MKPHTWEVVEVDGGILGVDDCWHCRSCGASGGPVMYDGRKEPPSMGAFISGTVWLDWDDCDRAQRQIEWAKRPCPTCGEASYKPRGKDCAEADHVAWYPPAVYAWEDVEWVIAHSPEDAESVYLEMIGEQDRERHPERWRKLDDLKILAVVEEDNQPAVRRACGQWVRRQGRGHLGSQNR
jgi:hypothetical protein